MTMSPAPTNFAEQVLREEADRIAKLKEKVMLEKVTEALKANEVREEKGKVNLKDEDNFPTLGKAKVTTPVWTNSSVAPIIAPPKPSTTSSTSPTISSSSNSSVRFILPHEHQRKDINVQASLNSTCARIMKDTETTIEVSVSGQNRAISFVLGGKPGNIKIAKRQLWSLLAQNGAIELEVPEECLRFIIGPSGKVLKEIETSCAVRVKIPRGEEWKGVVFVSGDFEGVAMARDKILSIVQERANKEKLEIEIERTLAPFLWVKELSGISQDEISELYPTVKVIMNRNSEGLTQVLTLIGDKNQVVLIQSLVAQALIRLRSSIKSVSTFVPKSLHRLLIGPKGSVLHQLEDETGCGISVPSSKDDPDNQQVTIFGPEDNLLQGLSSLMERIKGMSSEKISIPEISFKLIDKISKFRNELKSFDSEISIHFNSSNFSIEVDGKKENVLKFIAFLKGDLLQRLSSFKVQEALEVDQEYLKHVIGRKGQNLQQIQKDYDVEILIEDEIVSFIGKNVESVRKAKDHVNSILSNIVDLLTINVRIDSKYHGILIGSKGSNLAKYHEKYPAVMINFSNDEISFKGPRSEVEPCHTEMMQQADSIRHEMIMNSYTQNLSIPLSISKSSRDCAFLINFCRQNDCKLTIEDTLVTLQGSKKAVDYALPLLKNQVALIQDRDTLTFTVEPQYHGILIGSDGRNLKHLVQKYSVQVNFPKSKESDDKDTEVVSEDSLSDVIRITGPKANIAKARDELMDLLKYHLDHDNQETMTVPSKAIPFVIGKNGNTVDRIKIESDCKIDFTPVNNETKCDESVIKLSGTKESIKFARDLINRLVKDFMDQDEESIKVPESLLTTFKREYRKITQKYSKDDLMFFSRENTLKIKGKKEFVKSALEEIKSLISLIQSDSLIKKEIDIPTRVYGKILGVEAANIKELMKEFDCDIQVPKFGQNGPVLLIGPSESVQKCSEKIKSYCVEERLFKFPSINSKNSFLSNPEKANEILSPLKEWKNHSQGIILIGESEDIEKVKEAILSVL